MKFTRNALSLRNISGFVYSSQTLKNVKFSVRINCISRKSIIFSLLSLLFLYSISALSNNTHQELPQEKDVLKQESNLNSHNPHAAECIAEVYFESEGASAHETGSCTDLKMRLQKFVDQNAAKKVNKVVIKDNLIDNQIAISIFQKADLVSLNDAICYLKGYLVGSHTPFSAALVHNDVAVEYITDYIKELNINASTTQAIVDGYVAAMDVRRTC